MPIRALDEYPEVSSRSSVYLRAMMAFGDIEPDEQYLEDLMISPGVRLAALEPCWFTLKAFHSREIVEHFQPSRDIPRSDHPDYVGHPFWCAPCEGYNVLGLWFECDLQHQMQHRTLWQIDNNPENEYVQ